VIAEPHDNLGLIRKVLGSSYLELALSRLQVDETPDASTQIRVTVLEQGKPIEVEGKGVGVVDALFAGLLERYAREYQSLRSIELTAFRVSSVPDTKHVTNGADAVATATIDVLNSEGHRFIFSDSSRSIAASSARAVLEVVQYFVNAERAFVTLYNARKDALARGRDDLVARYTAEMAEVVESTSYAEVIDAIRREMK
jgi:hypothetical protein